jgi:subfamily B ATP-binding cassette protein MsbA
MKEDSRYTPGAVYRRLWGYARRYWWMFLIGLVGVSLDAAMQAVFIRFIEPLIDRVFVEKDSAYGLVLAAGTFVVIGLRVTGHFFGIYGMEWTGRRVVADLRRELFDSYLHLPATFFDRHSAGQLISKLAYNSEQVAQAVTNAVVSAVRDVMLVIYLLMVMLSLNAQLTAIMLMLVPAVAIVVTVVSRKFRKISRRIQDSMGDVSHVTEEAVVGQKVVKVFQGQEGENKRFEAVNERTRRLHMRMVATHRFHAAEHAERHYSGYIYVNVFRNGSDDSAIKAAYGSSNAITKRDRRRRKCIPGDRHRPRAGYREPFNRPCRW